MLFLQLKVRKIVSLKKLECKSTCKVPNKKINIFSVGEVSGEFNNNYFI